MAFENAKAEIALLLEQVQDAPHDRHELYLRIVQKLNELKAYGMPLPDDLVELEHRLEREHHLAVRLHLSAGSADRHLADPAERDRHVDLEPGL